MARAALVAAAAALVLAAAEAVPSQPQCADPSHVPPPALELETQAPAVRTESPVRYLSYVDQKVVFAFTENGHVWRSADGGKHWADDTPRLNGSLPVQRDVPDPDAPGHRVPSEATACAVPGVDRYGVASSVSHAAKPEVVLFKGLGHCQWVTTDGGVSYRPPCAVDPRNPECVEHPGGPNTLGGPTYRWHPRHDGRVLALARRVSCAFYAPETRLDCADDLFVSHNYGHTWTNLTAEAQGRIFGFVDFDWAPRGSSEGVPQLHEDDVSILATVYVEMSHRQAGVYQSGWNHNVHFVRSHDLFFSKHELVQPCGNGFEVDDDRVYLAVTRYCEDMEDPEAAAQPEWWKRQVTMKISKDAGRTFHLACFPGSIGESGYVLYYERHSFMIAVDHDEENELESSAPIGSLYSSDTSLQLFSLVMRRLVWDGPQPDYQHMYGIPAVHIANQLDGDALEDPLLIEGRTEFEDYFSTKVTYSSGATWQNLKPPVTDSLGKKIQCKNCKLHLHGISAAYGASGEAPVGAFYSTDYSPGLVIGTGNVGRYLTTDPRQVNTYMSRDGGFTWEEIRKGAHIYEIADFGGLLIIGSLATDGLTDELFFSRDDGACWEGPIKLLEPFTLHNIRVDNEGATSVFIAHGVKPGAPGAADIGVMYQLDFRSLLTAEQFPKCSPFSGYERWYPARDHCLMGRNFTMERRRRFQRCYNDLDYERRKLDETNCECQVIADFECAYGYEAVPPGNCEKILDLGEDDCPHELDNIRSDSPKHWRLIAGDTCLDPDHILYPNGKHVRPSGGGGHGGGGLSGAGVFFVVLFVLALVAATGAFAWTKLGLGERVPPEWRDAAAEFHERAKAQVATLFGDGSGARAGPVELQPERGLFQPLTEEEVA